MKIPSRNPDLQPYLYTDDSRKVSVPRRDEKPDHVLIEPAS